MEFTSIRQKTNGNIYSIISHSVSSYPLASYDAFSDSLVIDTFIKDEWDSDDIILLGKYCNELYDNHNKQNIKNEPLGKNWKIEKITDEMRKNDSYGLGDVYLIKALDHQNIATVHNWSPEDTAKLIAAAPYMLEGLTGSTMALQGIVSNILDGVYARPDQLINQLEGLIDHQKGIIKKAIE